MKTTNRNSVVTWAFAIAALAASVAPVAGCGAQKHADVLPVQNVAFTPDGSLVLFTALAIHVYRGGVETNKIPMDALPAAPGQRGYSFSMAAGGTAAAVAYSYWNESLTTGVAIYRIPDGTVLSTFQVGDAGTGRVSGLSLSPDAKLLHALSEVDGSMVLDTATGAPLWTGQSAMLQTVWSPDGKKLFSTSQGLDPASPSLSYNTLNARDAATGTLKWTFDRSGTSLRGLAVVGDGTLLASTLVVDDDSSCPAVPSGNACPPGFPFWSTADGTQAAQFSGLPQTYPYTALNAFAAFGCNATDTCATGIRDYRWSGNPEYARVYKTDGTVVAQVPVQGAAPSVAISPDGKLIAIASEFGSQDSAQVFSLPDGKLLYSIDFPGTPYITPGL